MRVKIHGGTADHGAPSLCLTCRWATVIRGPRLNNQIVECAQLSFTARRVNFPVVKCSDYADRRLASLKEMEEIAWILRSDTHRKRVGFVRSSELEDKDRFVLDD
ncbi:MAG TPA: hypothetical protein VM096_16800 [Vicinamibacterales bacterium]|nr:hypothetical protein [Vicinamibacterales bacterium]